MSKIETVEVDRVDRLLSISQLCEALGGCSVMTIERLLLKDETFPQPIRLPGSNTKRWFLAREVNAWIGRLVRGRGGRKAKAA